MPSMGRFHCKPAMARASASTTSRRRARAVQCRQAPICTSDFQESQTTHGTAASRVKSQIGLVNWKFISGPRLLAQELLHAMIQRVGHVKIPLGIQRDAPRLAELSGRAARPAQDFQRLVLGAKNLVGLVAELETVFPPPPAHLV